jgi:hypothetical protein
MRRLLLLLALIACHRDPPPTVDASPLATVHDLTLPVAIANARPDHALNVFVTRRELLVGDRVLGPVPPDGDKGFDVALKNGSRNGFLLGPLKDAVHGEKEALVYADQSTPYRMLTEVLYTLGQAGATRWFIATSSGAFEIKSADSCVSNASVTSALNDFAALSDSGSPIPVPVCPGLNAVIRVDGAGVGIKAKGQNLALGCNGPGTGLAVQNKDGHVDYEGIGACLRTLKASSPEYATETTVTLVASSLTTTQTVVQVFQVALGEGKPFHDAALGLPFD